MEWLHDWFATPAGRDLAARESRLLSRRLAGLYARRVLQLGAYGNGFCPTVYGDARQWVMDDWPGGPIDLRAERTVIPLASGSVDVVILVHQLEFCDRPHQVFREAARVLAPEGHLLVLGFNPFSLWGLRRLLPRAAGRPPWSGRYLSAGRMTDWMLLLGLTPRKRDSLAPLPPPLQARFTQSVSTDSAQGQSLRLAWRWCGGVNLIMGQKRVHGAKQPPLRWRQRLELMPGRVAEAGLRRAQPEIHRDAS